QYLRCLLLILPPHGHHRDLHSFPTRRSSDLYLNRKLESRYQRITREVVSRYGTAVMAGPFAGMHYVSTAVGSTFLPKLLGTYEEIGEHTSELQSLAYLVCRLLLEKKNEITCH